MPTARYGPGVAASSHGKIYAIGGYGSSGSAIVEEYDPLSNAWSTCTSMPNGSWGLGVATASNGKIYSIGGVNGNFLSTVEEYDPASDTWRTQASMPTTRDLVGVTATSNGKIYAIGGNNNGSILSTVEEYTIPEYGKGVFTNYQWLDLTHFRTSYDFSILNTKGNYTLTVELAKGADGLLIAPDSRTVFTVNYAGAISDTTPPSPPLVSAWGNGTLTNLSARGEASDPEFNIIGYRYAIGTTPGTSDVVGWTNSPIPQITRSELNLMPDVKYYVSFKACNTGGLWSQAGSSNYVVNGVAGGLVYLPALRK
jgi:hypothetical protein